MHSTEGKREACQLKPWERRNADRVCEHGDSTLKQETKRQANKARRREDKESS